MKVNKKLREALYEISEKSLEMSNTPDAERAYIKRFVKLYTKKLKEREQVYVMSKILEELSFKSKIGDPERINELYTIKGRFVFQTLLGIGVIIVAAGMVFRTNPYLNAIVDAIGKSFSLFGLE